MADDADNAFELQQQWLRRSLHDSRRNPYGIEPEGYCHYCGESFSADVLIRTPGKLFCDSDCATSFEVEYQARKRAADNK